MRKLAITAFALLFNACSNPLVSRAGDPAVLYCTNGAVPAVSSLRRLLSSAVGPYYKGPPQHDLLSEHVPALVASWRPAAPVDFSITDPYGSTAPQKDYQRAFFLVDARFPIDYRAAGFTNPVVFLNLEVEEMNRPTIDPSVRPTMPSSYHLFRPFWVTFRVLDEEKFCVNS